MDTLRKTGVCFLFILLPWGLGAQNYECLKPGLTVYFTDGTIQNPLRADSVTQENGYQVWWNFPVIRPSNEYYCHVETGGMWMGRITRIYPDGRYVFYNRDALPIEIHSQAGLNDTWKCCDLETGRVDATVTGIEPETFLGLSDMVKTITLQAKDAQGNNQAHDLNGKQFKISQNYGFTQVIGVYLFPDLTCEIPDEIKEYSLSGLSEPQAGYQNLTFDAVYDLQPGDELHVYSKNEYFIPPVSGNEYMAIKVLTSRSYSSSGNELILTWDVCSRRRQYEGMADTLIFFTGSETETLLVEDLRSKLDPLPGEVIAPDPYPSWLYYNMAYHEAFGRPYKQLYMGFYQVPEDTCLGLIVTKKGSETTQWAYPSDYYAEGLGGPYYTYWDFSFNTRELVYWKKGTQEWGTPYTCSEILGELPLPGQIDWTVSPNPVRDGLIRVRGIRSNNTRLVLTDMTGRRLHEYTLQPEQEVIQLPGLSSGLYFLQMKEGTQTGTLKLIVD